MERNIFLASKIIFLLNTYFSSTKDLIVNGIYSTIINSVFNFIGPNMEIQNLVGKNISVGKRLFEHPNFIQTIKDNSLFKN